MRAPLAKPEESRMQHLSLMFRFLAFQPPTPALVRKAARIRENLERCYPQVPRTLLQHRDPFTLLLAVVLSAQCTDLKVNGVTPKLFELAPTPQALLHLGEQRIREIIRPLGLAPRKARALVGIAERLLEEHGGQVPRTFAELEALPGVGHKTASVVLSQAFGEPAFPVDTHIHRLAQRWGLGGKSVEETESTLKAVFPDPSSWAELHVRMILFGREHCPAIRHDMDACPICSWAAVPEARRANKRSPRKFIGIERAKNPAHIRATDKARHAAPAIPNAPDEPLVDPGSADDKQVFPEDSDNEQNTMLTRSRKRRVLQERQNET
jgi:endonuclease-3